MAGKIIASAEYLTRSARCGMLQQFSCFGWSALTMFFVQQRVGLFRLVLQRLAWLLLLSCVVATAQAAIPLCSADTQPFYSASLPEQGPVIRLIRSAYQRQGQSIDVQFMPWARAYEQALAGECGLIGLWPTAERDQLFLYSEPLMSLRLGYFTRRSTRELAQILALQSPRLGVQRGAYLNQQVAQLFVHRVESSDVVQALQQLAKGRVDVVFANREAGLYLLSQSPQLAAQVHYLQDVEQKHAVLAFSRQQPDAARWLNAFNRGFAGLAPISSY